jgi:hypothetical protein
LDFGTTSGMSSGLGMDSRIVLRMGTTKLEAALRRRLMLALVDVRRSKISR